MRRTGSTASSALRVSKTRPSSPYFQVWLGLDVLGTFEQTENGFVVSGGRKVLPNIEAAAREVAWKRAQHSLREAARFSEASLKLPVSVDAVDPVEGSSNG